MNRGAKFGALAAAILGAGLLFVPRSSCACIPPIDAFVRCFGVDPTSVGSTASRAAMLRVIPPGTSADAARDVYWRRLPAPRCTEAPEATRCELQLSSSSFGLHRRMLYFNVLFDAEGRVVDITARVTRRILGTEL